MKRRKFFQTAGEKRKFYNNMRHFGRTREIGLACLGLAPALGILGIVAIALVAGFVLFSGGSHEFMGHASKSGSHFAQLTLSGAALFGTVAVANARSLEQKKADLIKDNQKLISDAEAADKDLEGEALTTYNDNKAEIAKLNGRIQRLRDQEEDEHSVASGERFLRSTVVEVKDKPKFKSLGEQLFAVVKNAMTRGVVTDPRLVAVGSPEHKLMAAAAGLNEDVPAEGGFLVQQDLAQGLLQKTYETGEILRLITNPIEVSSVSNRIVINGIDEQSRANGSRFGGVQAFWANEAQSITATKPKFRRVELILNKIMAVCFATDEMLADASAMESIINDVFPQEFAFRIEDAIINGVGNGQPLGVLNSPALVVQAKEGAQAANTVVAANVMKMWSRMWGRSRQSAVWLIDQSIEPQLYQFTITSTGVSVPIYLPPGGLSASPYGTLFGRPVITTEYNAALTNQGDIILVDFSQYALARKSVLQAASSMHVNFLTDEMAFRFTQRLDGQPTWNTALTPKNAGPTLSPYVTLQAR